MAYARIVSGRQVKYTEGLWSSRDAEGQTGQAAEKKDESAAAREAK